MKLDTRRKTIVLTHGYGSGLGFWFSNIDFLARLRDGDTGLPYNILLVDWLGMACSSRPPFLKRCSGLTRVLQKTKPKCQNTNINNNDMNIRNISNIKSVTDHEDYFIDSLELWRKAIGLTTPFTLVGHSLGGYLSAAYALKYGGLVNNDHNTEARISQLILVSPFGLGDVRKFISSSSTSSSSSSC